MKNNLHVTLLDVFISMLINTILLAALAVQSKEATNRHTRLVILMKKPTGIPLHTKASEPVSAHRLPEAPPTGKVP